MNYNNALFKMGIIILISTVTISDSKAQYRVGLQVDPSHIVLFGQDTLGTGTRLMWHPDRKTLVAAEDTGSGDELNPDSLARHSAIFGQDNKTSFSTIYAIINGVDNIINRGNGYINLNGIRNQIGRSSYYVNLNGVDNISKRSTDYAMVNGRYNTIGDYADYATVNGFYNMALTDHETIFGRNADTSDVVDYDGRWVGSHQLFALGNGESETQRNSALTVLKNGKVGVNISRPDAFFHIDSSGTAGQRSILLALTSGTSRRPSIQFSENAGQGGETSGMSIEYNGVGSGDNNKMIINSTSSEPIVAVENGGDVYLTHNTNTGGLANLFLPGHIYIAPYNGSDISYLQARRGNGSGDTQLNLRTFNDGALTEAVQIKKDGDVDIKGYTRLGEGAPAIKYKKIEITNLTTSHGVGVQHGLDLNKILGMTSRMQIGQQVYFPNSRNLNNGQTSTEYEYAIHIDGGYVWATAFGSRASGETVQVTLMYEE